MIDNPGDEALDTDVNQASSTGGITRRDLLYLGGLTAGALAVPTVLKNINPVSASTALRDRYDADVLVVGSGFAGVFAAVEAAQMGQKVVLVDKGTVGWSGMTPWASQVSRMTFFGCDCTAASGTTLGMKSRGLTRSSSASESIKRL